GIQDEYANLREKHAGRRARKHLVSIAEARQRHFQTDWSQYAPPAPRVTGRHLLLDYDLAELRQYIDWTPFFHTWELAGKFPHIFEDELVGQTARQLYEDAQAMLDCMIQERWVQANGVIAFYPANSEGDDILVYEDEARSPDDVRTVVHTIRQQMEKPPGRPNLALADYIAPRESGRADWLGFFAVEAGLWLPEA